MSKIAKREVIDVGPRKRRRLKIWLICRRGIAAAVSLSRILSIYLSALWFESLGYSSVYWYIFKVKLALFLGSAILTALLLSATFLLFQRLFGAYAFENRTIILNNQPFQFSPAKFIRPLGWVIAVLFGLIYGFRLKEHWRQFALFWNQPSTAIHDPIFGSHSGSIFLAAVLRSGEFVAARSIVHHTLRRACLFTARFAANRTQAERALVVGRRVSRPSVVRSRFFYSC